MESTNFCSNCKRDVAASNFAIHSAFCERKIQLCKKCDEPVHRAELEEHEKEYHSMDVCANCDMPMEKWVLSKHEDSCPKKPVTCEFCDISIALDELDDHTQFCGSRTEQCHICKQYVLLKDKENHPESCLKSQKCDIYNRDDSNASSTTTDFRRASFPVKDTVVTFVDRTSDISNQTSEVYSALSGECAICHNMIPWIDMNMHIPACSTYHGKCSGCGERIPSNQLKDHVLTSCPKTLCKRIDPNQDITKGSKYIDKKTCIRKINEDESNHNCPYCKKYFSKEIIMEHLDSCPQNTSPCELCLNFVPANELEVHQLSCKMLIGENAYLSSYKTRSRMHSMPSAAVTQGISENDTKVCSVCQQSIPKIRFEPHFKHCTKNLAVGEDFHKAQNSIRQGSLENETKLCLSCEHLISVAKFKDHSFYCHKQKKRCTFCYEEYTVGDDKSHIMKCRKVAESIEEQTKSDKSVMDKTKTQQLRKIYMPLECPYCESLIEEHSYSDHLAKCCEHNTKVPVSSNSSNTLERRSQEFTANESKIAGTRKKQCNNKSDNSSKRGRSIMSKFSNIIFPPAQQQERPRKDIAHGNVTEEFRLPCEFCGQLYPPYFIIEHQSGCRPDLVSYSKNYMPAKQNVHTESANEKLASTESYLYADERKNGARRKFNRSEKGDDIKPGEFLHRDYTKLPSSHAKNSENQYSKASHGTFRDVEKNIDKKSKTEICTGSKDKERKTRNSDRESDAVKEHFANVKSCWNYTADSSRDDIQELESVPSRHSVLHNVFQLNKKSESDMNDMVVHTQKDEVAKNYSTVADKIAIDENKDTDLEVLLKHCKIYDSIACHSTNLKNYPVVKSDLLSQNSTPASSCCTDFPCNGKENCSLNNANSESKLMEFSSTGAFPKNTASYSRLKHMELWQNISEQDEALVSNPVRAKSSYGSGDSKNEFNGTDSPWKEWHKKESSDSE